MSELQTPKEVFFFASLLYRLDLFTHEKITSVANSVLAFDLEFTHHHFPMKDYYSKEMGNAQMLNRLFLVCSIPMDRKRLVEMKLQASEIEKSFSLENRRTLNFDIGFISMEQVVLATGKPYYHRIYLDHGVYANLELYQNEDEFKIFPWSYPDYGHEDIRRFFHYCRNLLKNSLNQF